MEFFANQHDRLSLYRSLCAVKVLLAPLCSTLTVLAPRESIACHLGRLCGLSHKRHLSQSLRESRLYSFQFFRR
jgi:hypothetical protein